MKIGQTVIVDRLVAGEEEALMAHTLIAFKEEVSALLLLVFLKCILSKVCLSKVYFCEMYPTCVSSKHCEFISDALTSHNLKLSVILGLHSNSFTGQICPENADCRGDFEQRQSTRGFYQGV